MLWFFALTTVLFAAAAIYFSYKEEKAVRDSKINKKEIDRKIYELNILRNITEKVGYSLNVESIAETISLTCENLFDLSTVSYAIISDKTIKIRTFPKENVSNDFIHAVSKIITDSLCTIDAELTNYKIEDVPVDIKSITSEPIDIVIISTPLSYFNIPLVVNNKLVGMINVASRKKDVYQDADMSLLYKIINTAQVAIGRLNDVIETEKGKLDSLIMGLPSGTIMFSAEGGQFELSVINQAAKDFLNLEGEATISDVLRILPAQLNITQNIKSVFETKRPVIFQNIKISQKYFTIYLNPVFLHGRNEIIGVSCVMRDMSLERQIEQIRSDFTNMIVHELRAPTSAIRGAASLLLSENLSKTDREKMMHVISDSTANMLSTINELLDVAEMEEGKLSIKREKADLSKVILDHIDVFSYAARQKNVTIGFAREGEIPEFSFDPGRVGQVINNLVSNALKFTKDGGQPDRQAKIEIKICRKDESLEVCVEDNGVGIPQDKKELLFTKFGQIGAFSTGFVKHEASGPEGLRPGGGSSGLGLYISKQIIEAHGGKIWIDSEQGQGTKVYFTLPLFEQIKKALPINQKFAN